MHDIKRCTEGIKRMTPILKYIIYFIHFILTKNGGGEVLYFIDNLISNFPIPGEKFYCEIEEHPEERK